MFCYVNSKVIHIVRFAVIVFIQNFTNGFIRLTFCGFNTDEEKKVIFQRFALRKVFERMGMKDIEEAKTYLHEKHTAINSGKTLFYYAICLKGNNIPIGYIHVSGGDSYDLGYGLRKEFWHKGICSEACRVVIEKLKHIEIPYITATHDVNNPRSGRVMQAIGMKYRYSYNELWQPKNKWVTFRMYQLNLDGQENRIYKKYWNKYPIHFVETIPK